MNKILETLQMDASKSVLNRVSHLILEKPEYLSVLLECLDIDEKAQKRAVGVLKKISQQSPQLLNPYKSLLFEHLLETSLPQVQWSLCQVIILLDIDSTEFERLRPRLLTLYQRSASRVVMAYALTAVVELSITLNLHVEEAFGMIQEALKSRIPAVAARARHLNARFTKKIRPTWWK